MTMCQNTRWENHASSTMNTAMPAASGSGAGPAAPLWLLIGRSWSWHAAQIGS